MVHESAIITGVPDYTFQVHLPVRHLALKLKARATQNETAGVSFTFIWDVFFTTTMTKYSSEPACPIRMPAKAANSIAPTGVLYTLLLSQKSVPFSCTSFGVTSD